MIEHRISMILPQVFNRLLGTHNNESGVPHTSPITPAELLIALHNIDSSKAELKTIIKGDIINFFFVKDTFFTLRSCDKIDLQLRPYVSRRNKCTRRKR